MTEDRTQSQRSGQSRKPQLSPDVAEFLSMLDAIEAGVTPKAKHN